MPPPTTVANPTPPPVIRIPHSILYAADNAGHKAYDAALNASDGVVIVPRQGREEYIIDHKYAHEVLTDNRNYVFDKGVVKMLHMEFMLWFKNGSFVTELDGLVATTVQGRLGAVIRELGPLLRKGFDQQFPSAPSTAFEKGGSSEEVHDLFNRVQKVIALAMAMLICGPEHVVPSMIDRFVTVTNSTARLCGFYEQSDAWPLWARGIYPYWATFTALLVIGPQLIFGILPDLWRARHTHVRNAVKRKPSEFTPLFPHLLVHHWSEEQSLLNGLGNFLWCSIAASGVIFASIHQTVVVAVWVMVELARRKEVYLPKIREEWTEHLPDGDASINIQSLNKLEYLDSFIREIMRTKGDAFAPVRLSTGPVRVGGHLIPANAICLPYVRRAHVHPDYYGNEGDVFDGVRWIDKSRPAVQGSESFLSFGLGRWACPGRHLAVAEIKILVYMLFERFNVDLDEKSFLVLDPLNTTSVPPQATLRIRSRTGVA